MYGKLLRPPKQNRLVSRHFIRGRGWADIVFLLTLFTLHVLIEAGAVIDCDCEIQDYAYIGPGAIIGARAVIESKAAISAGANINPGIRIGSETFVYPGVTALHDVLGANHLHFSHEA